VPGHARFRVNAYFQRSAIGAAFRLIPAELTTIDDLGLPSAVHEFTKNPRGMVLVTGPTGSGKSTSLAAMIDQINATREEHIMTVEDPIEFLHAHKKCIVNQREVGSDMFIRDRSRPRSPRSRSSRGRASRRGGSRRGPGGARREGPPRSWWRRRRSPAD
jgi:Tfp pilus assembly pilus retraction ATPase PilT